MTDTPHTLNRIWFTLSFRDSNWLGLARAALNLHAAVQFAQDHGLAVHEDSSKDYFDLALLVPTPRLTDTLQELAAEGIVCGTVDCFDRDAYTACRPLSVVSVLMDEADNPESEPTAAQVPDGLGSSALG